MNNRPSTVLGQGIEGGKSRNVVAAIDMAIVCIHYMSARVSVFVRRIDSVFDLFHCTPQQRLLRLHAVYRCLHSNNFSEDAIDRINKF